MTLGQALVLVQQQKGKQPRRSIFLVCGFQPQHVASFIAAHSAACSPAVTVDVRTGLYGDFQGSLTAAADSDSDAAVVAIEWSDLDARLGFRGAGGWGPSLHADIISNCQDGWSRILEKLTAIAARMPVAMSLPTLPLPLFGHTAGWQLSTAEAELERQAAAFAADALRISSVHVVHAGRLAALSPVAARYDAKLDVGAGFPYSIGHASAVALQVVQILNPSAPKKGLITDLDNTLWSGIVGEIGASEVKWSLADRSQIHGLYQQQLRSLSEMGVLLAVVSKNDLSLAEEALRRSDLYMPADAFFPVRADWNPKSQAVAEVLQAWNVGPESVVFVDDSAMELDEVRHAFPSMTCLQFPTGQPVQTLQLLEQLRDLFGKPILQKEDALRQSTIRSNALVREGTSGSGAGDFVRQLRGTVRFESTRDASNKRLLELINKTNQFNLNGKRVSEAEWMRHLGDQASFAVGVSYEDKFGPLGVIGVVAGKRSGDRLEVPTWVLSCRAFSRAIELHTLAYLFESTGAKTILLDFQPTERNEPVQRFLRSLGMSAGATGPWEISPDDLLRGDNSLPHALEVKGEI